MKGCVKAKDTERIMTIIAEITVVNISSEYFKEFFYSSTHPRLAVPLL